MFDVGFSELVLVGLVALLVFGPERLPKVAREVGAWVRKARALASSVKQEIDHELELQELKQSLLEQKNKVQTALSEQIDVTPSVAEKDSQAQKIGRASCRERVS
jgi:sec-independent protein translocase protein TatB